MTQRNMTDIIEAYLKAYLENQEHLEIKRSDIADRFDCVPSQINYVINTRFTQEHGYLVESKRGGGGYIRILKVHLVDEVDEIDQMIDLIGNQISQRNGINIIETLTERKIITQREAALILSVIEKAVLQTITEEEQIARAQLLKTFLYQLRYTYE
ncbi:MULTISPECIES: CtsR family transcriptional regulator [Globicatella]|uniref:Transcriptional regulator CtsR n=1 Tax=Globicatella sulfidifaciens TaxID=136093 RepID=A0A7X8GZI2_9LACT|nr:MULTISPECIES: CtsR family transcriptional regulator [Globicatella]MDK7631535.1 CtsR family transcriptional regulator [Globicatella sanguinis]NLJ17844.1 CtsR family transcriptional regulator [Globicatella sulfidifaciens]WIK65508.1 CtsR family transcriptional regulator [Globicatella sanguinis]WKT54913.1 CtsR family transcriptional regulator [Globicatella sanguinis]